MGIVTGAATLALAACGSGRSQSNAWVQKVNAVCKRHDKIVLASGMTMAGLVQWNAEMAALTRAGAFQHITNLERDSQTLYHLLRYSSSSRAMDRAALKMKRDASAYGVHCSFGSFPLPP
jgi:hypothetical protein